MGAVSQTIFRMVAAILRTWAGHERFVAMWGSWPSCRSRSHSEGYTYMGQVVMSLISRIMYIHRYAIVQQRRYGIRAWGWLQLTMHLTWYIYTSEAAANCQWVKLFCASIIHMTPPHHTAYTHPHPPCTTPVTPHAHMYIQIVVHVWMFNNCFITAMSYYKKVRQYKVKVLLLI